MNASLSTNFEKIVLDEIFSSASPDFYFSSSKFPQFKFDYISLSIIDWLVIFN